MNINQLAANISKSGFEIYGSFNEGDCEHAIFTCTKGKYSGEVIDVYYNYNSGDISKVEQYTQFPVGHPHYAPVQFVLPATA